MLDIERIMSRPVFACGPDDTLNAAARLMWDHDCGVVVVVDDGGRLVGMLTDRDICMAAYTRGQPLSEIAVRLAMSTEVEACQTTDSIASVEQKMANRQVRRIPVVDGSGQPIGVVSLNDLALAAAREGPSRAADLGGVAKTLAAVCEHQVAVHAA